MNELLTIREVAQYLRIHPTTCYRLLKQRKMPAFKITRSWRFERQQIDLWLKQQEPSHAG